MQHSNNDVYEADGPFADPQIEPEPEPEPEPVRPRGALLTIMEMIETAMVNEDGMTVYADAVKLRFIPSVFPQPVAVIVTPEEAESLRVGRRYDMLVREVE